MHCVEHLSPVLNEMALGLNCNNFRNKLADEPDLFKHVFCPSSFFQWDLSLLVDHLHPLFDEGGGNRKSKEVATFKAFVDFTEQCYYDGKQVMISLNLSFVIFDGFTLYLS